MTKDARILKGKKFDQFLTEIDHMIRYTPPALPGYSKEDQDIQENIIKATKARYAMFRQQLSDASDHFRENGLSSEENRSLLHKTVAENPLVGVPESMRIRIDQNFSRHFDEIHGILSLPNTSVHRVSQLAAQAVFNIIQESMRSSNPKKNMAYHVLQRLDMAYQRHMPEGKRTSPNMYEVFQKEVGRQMLQAFGGSMELANAILGKKNHASEVEASREVDLQLAAIAQDYGFKPEILDGLRAWRAGPLLN